MDVTLAGRVAGHDVTGLKDQVENYLGDGNLVPARSRQYVGDGLWNLDLVSHQVIAFTPNWSVVIALAVNAAAVEGSVSQTSTNEP